MRNRVLLGSNVSCDDGLCGKVARVVIDPATSTVTGFVVEPLHRSGLGRLVPTSSVTIDSDAISIASSSACFEDFPSAEETDYTPGGSGKMPCTRLMRTTSRLSASRIDPTHSRRTPAASWFEIHHQKAPENFGERRCCARRIALSGESSESLRTSDGGSTSYFSRNGIIGSLG